MLRLLLRWVLLLLRGPSVGRLAEVGRAEVRLGIFLSRLLLLMLLLLLLELLRLLLLLLLDWLWLQLLLLDWFGLQLLLLLRLSLRLFRVVLEGPLIGPAARLVLHLRGLGFLHLPSLH